MSRAGRRAFAAGTASASGAGASCGRAVVARARRRTVTISRRAPASAEPGPAKFCQEFVPELNEFLSTLIDAPVNLTQGSCVSAIQAGNPTAAAAALCRTPEISEFVVGDANHGKCQQAVKEFLEDLFD